MNTEYNVIWIDDEWEKMSQFKQECEVIHQIKLYPFKTQKSGMEALDTNLKKWDAVLLDAKMFDESEENEVAKLDGLRKAIEHINQLSLRRKIPYFISTGQPDLMNNETFEQSFGKYYIKKNDDLQLIADMKEIIGKTERFQMKLFYSEAIKVLSDLNQNASDIILDIFEAMHFPDKHPDFNPILYYNQLRQILEYNFRLANKVCIVPNECFDKKGNPNLSQCSHYLSGNNATEAGVRYGDYRGKNDYDKVVPPHIELMMRMILDVGNINSHSTKLNDAELQELEQYFNKNVFNSRYLIFSMALNACEITLWMKDYTNNHQDIDENIKMCRPIPDNQTTSKEIDKTDIKEDELIGVVICDEGIYHIGSRFFVNKSYIDRNNLLNKKVRILEHDINSNSGTKEKYPYFACKVKLIK